MARTSIQDILIDEVKEIRKDAQTNLQNSQMTREMLVEIATTLKEVKVQTEKTNGRVTKVEERLNMHRGGIVVAWALVGIAVAIIKYIN